MNDATRAQVRRELDAIGVVRVKRGMIAFEHREDALKLRLCPACHSTACCFLAHATGAVCATVGRIGYEQGSAVENAFEEWEHKGFLKGSRAELYQEIVAWLAEHGTAQEPAVSATTLDVAG